MTLLQSTQPIPNLSLAAVSQEIAAVEREADHALRGVVQRLTGAGQSLAAQLDQSARLIQRWSANFAQQPPPASASFSPGPAVGFDLPPRLDRAAAPLSGDNSGRLIALPRRETSEHQPRRNAAEWPRLTATSTIENPRTSSIPLPSARPLALEPLREPLRRPTAPAEGHRAEAARPPQTQPLEIQIQRQLEVKLNADNEDLVRQFRNVAKELFAQYAATVGRQVVGEMSETTSRADDVELNAYQRQARDRRSKL